MRGLRYSVKFDDGVQASQAKGLKRVGQAFMWAVNPRRNLRNVQKPKVDTAAQD